MRRRTILRHLASVDSKSTLGGFLYLAPDAVLEFLAHDLPAAEGLVLAAAQQPIRASALLDRSDRSRVARQAFLVRGYR